MVSTVNRSIGQPSKKHCRHSNRNASRGPAERRITSLRYQRLTRNRNEKPFHLLYAFIVSIGLIFFYVYMRSVQWSEYDQREILYQHQQHLDSKTLPKLETSAHKSFEINHYSVETFQEANHK